jgi:DNA end-binding protein Ku
LRTRGQELVDAKINHLAVPKDEVSKRASGKVIHLVDALRKSIKDEKPRVAKKPAVSEKAPMGKGIGLVKSSSKSAMKRKSA